MVLLIYSFSYSTWYFLFRKISKEFLCRTAKISSRNWIWIWETLRKTSELEASEWITLIHIHCTVLMGGLFGWFCLWRLYSVVQHVVTFIIQETGLASFRKKKILNGINNPLLFNNLQSMPQHMHYQVNIFWEILSLTAETYPARIGSSIHAVSHKKPNSAPTTLLIEFNMIQFILRISLTDLLRHTSLPFFSPFTFTVSFYWSPSLFFFLVSLPCFPLFLRCPPPIHQAEGKMGLSCLPFKGHYDVMHVIVAKHTIRYITNAFIHQLWRWWN